MRQFKLLGLLALLLFVTATFAQDDGADGDEEKGEECEEAWDYVEFLKESVK